MAPKLGKNLLTPIPTRKKSILPQKKPKQYIVEKIISKRITINGKIEYLLKWEGHMISSWEPEENLDCPDLVQKFESNIDTTNRAGCVDSIIGAESFNKEIFYLIKYADNKIASEFLPSRLVKQRYPQLLIDFYERRCSTDDFLILILV
ncbi:hypothetical protein Mgra_00001061 [Meloidogyne graminicola]|uniref:Chromo domain-containing protein n=1 Tax=Meloidogyne graminicola TaxID=189291 RepID=A0A8T0A059_9BILA|nr:hypothetical protein Mgra_00001061 [Meloidogyne graminicola]